MNLLMLFEDKDFRVFRQMNRWLKRWVTVVGCLMLLVNISGCSRIKSFIFQDDTIGDRDVYKIKQISDPVAPMVLRSVGYGAVNEKARAMTKVQRRLVAMRASKLDAYRTLAERVYGIQMRGGSTVEDLVVSSDKFKTYVDTYIHGARVVSIDRLADGSYETVLEMVIDEGFRNCITSKNFVRHNISCRAPVVHDIDAYKQNRARMDDSSRSGNGSLYYLD